MSMVSILLFLPMVRYVAFLFVPAQSWAIQLIHVLLLAHIYSPLSKTYHHVWQSLQTNYFRPAIVS